MKRQYIEPTTVHVVKMANRALLIQSNKVIKSYDDESYPAYMAE